MGDHGTKNIEEKIWGVQWIFKCEEGNSGMEEIKSWLDKFNQWEIY